MVSGDEDHRFRRWNDNVDCNTYSRQSVVTSSMDFDIGTTTRIAMPIRDEEPLAPDRISTLFQQAHASTTI